MLENYFNQISQIKHDLKYDLRDFMNIEYMISNFHDKNYKLTKKKVLDLGCGNKRLENIFIKYNNNYTGYDYSDYDFESDLINIPSEKYDLILSIAVIEHLSNPDKYIKNIFNLLKNNGYLYLITPNINLTKHSFYDDYTHKKPYTPLTLKRIFNDYGFNSIKLYPGLRLKPKWFYKGKFCFYKANYLIPFDNLNKSKLIPSFLKGKSKSIILICQK